MALSNLPIAIKSEINVFDQAPIQDTFESSYYTEFRPTSSGLDDVVEFELFETQDFLDLSLTKLHLKVRIIDPDGNPVKNLFEKDANNVVQRKGIHVAPCCNFLGSLFTQVMVFVNHQCITPPDNNYHIRSYLDQLLNYGTEAKFTHLVGGMYMEDTVGEFDKFDNNGSLARMARMGPDGNIELIGYLHADIAKTSKVLPNNMKMRIKLYRNKPAFSLMTSEPPAAGKQYKIEITDATLLVRKLKGVPQAVNRFESKIMSQTAKYNISRSEVKTYTIPANTITHVIDNFVGSQLPKRIFIMATEEDREYSYTLNPYKFEHFKLRFAQLSGDVLTNIRPIRMNVEANEYMEAYLSLFDALNVRNRNIGNSLTPADFIKNSFIIAWDLSSDQQASDGHVSIAKTGVLRLQLQYAEKLAKNIKLIVFTQMDSLVQIDSNRNPILNYSA